MTADLRRAQILERIRRNGGASVAELCREYDVSPITVYRDLEQLSRQGLIERVHGGARSLSGFVTHTETDWTKRLRSAYPAKEAIGAYAGKWIEDGETIFLDASTTCLALARALERHPPRALTLVTNSPAIAFELRAEPIHVIVTPGEVDQTLRMIAGRWTVEFLEGLNFSTAFISAAGITLEQGLTTSQLPIVDTLTAARGASMTTVGLIDSSKFGRRSLLPIADPRELDALVVDPGLAPETLEAYRQADIPITIVGEDRYNKLVNNADGTVP